MGIKSGLLGASYRTHVPAMRRRHHIRHKTGNDSAILQADPIEDGGLPLDQSIFETTKEAQEHATDRRCDGAVRINGVAAGCDWGGGVHAGG